MEKYRPLADLLQALEQGNRYHICLEFIDRVPRRQLRLPKKHFVHATQFCDEMKNSAPGALDRCLRCKGKVIGKLRQTRQPFGGFCTFGAWEYCYPVFQNGSLFCVILLGNILKDRAVTAERSGRPKDDPLFETMEPELSLQQCEKLCRVVESYLRLLLEQDRESAQGRSTNITIAAIKAYVDAYFYHDITMESLARLYHYNEKYLGSLFKRQTGKSFHNYLNEHRLEHAKILLRTGQGNILTVAERSGFNDVVYFNRIFKAHTGMTPTQYRVKFMALDQEDRTSQEE